MIRENTDNHAVLMHLQHYGSITTQSALHSLGVMRLSARIDQLRKAGYQIKTIMKTIIKRSTGKKVRVAVKYKLTVNRGVLCL